MFSTARLTTLLISLALLAGLAPAQAQAAGALKKADANGFDNATTVSDTELSTMRGGFVDINGVLIDFSFLSRVEVGSNVFSNVSFNGTDVLQGAITAAQAAAINQPVIVQNAANDTAIAIQQALNLSITNTQVLSNMSQGHQLDFLQSLAH